jgi:hypothetical protein
MDSKPWRERRFPIERLVNFRSPIADNEEPMSPRPSLHLLEANPDAARPFLFPVKM